MITATKPTQVSQAFRMTSYGLGLWVTGMAVAQMVSFEEFVRALEGYKFAGETGSVALAIALIALEIFSVPFLFRLTMSPLARMFSALFTVLLPCVWVVLLASVLLRDVSVANAGLFGGFMEVQVSALILTLAVAWMTVVGWSFGPLGGHKALHPQR